jgi:CRP-like cAMP-binding protein
MPESIEDMLAGTALFSRVDRDDLHEIAAWVQLQNYNAGQVIQREGELGTALYIIRSGAVDVYQGYGDSEHQQQLASFGEGDFFGEMALLLGHPRSATIVASEDTECMTILRSTFQGQSNKEVLWAMLQHVAERLAHADETIGEMHSH